MEYYTDDSINDINNNNADDGRGPDDECMNEAEGSSPDHKGNKGTTILILM